MASHRRNEKSAFARRQIENSRLYAVWVYKIYFCASIMYMRRYEMKKTIKKTILITSALCILISLAAVFPRAEDFEIYEKTVRLHVIANSDSEQDQALKLKVRDCVLGYLSVCLDGVTDIESAAEIINREREGITEAANRCLEESGSGYTANVAFCEEKYPRKEYGEITLPAGKYLSLQVKIGKSEGKNWWCVLFPTICTSSAEPKDQLTQAGFTSGQVRLITESEKPKYKLRFKLVEIIEDIFN